jgi:uncharacterized protein (TIGR03435 family)
MSSEIEQQQSKMLISSGSVSSTRFRGRSVVDPALIEKIRYRMGATNAPVTKLVSKLSLLLARPVYDATGLEGGYDFQLY